MESLVTRAYFENACDQRQQELLEIAGVRDSKQVKGELVLLDRGANRRVRS